ncbi:MAG TPA: hypothetical protein VFR37_24470 [Longimicrobium sp.]|nr:hypothetical protein [Longimicrobium sp.]
MSDPLLPVRGRWIRRGGGIVLLPAPLSRDDGGMQSEVAVTATPAGVIDGRIDVHAQYALLRLSKGDPAAQGAARGLLSAVKSGALAGIYKEDQLVPAQRARRLKTSWWQVIPRGEDGDLVFDAREAPLVVFRNALQKDAVRMDRVLRTLWSRFSRLAGGASAPRGYGRSGGAQPMAARARFSETENPFKDDLCNSITLPCAGRGMERAVCDFRALLNNPRLVCNGQHYWSALAAEALEMGPLGTPGTSRIAPDGPTLFRALWTTYRSRIEPRDPAGMQHWFQSTYGRPVQKRDVDALWAVEADLCHETVGHVAELVLGTKPEKRVNCLGSLGYEELVSGTTGAGEQCRPRGKADMSAKVSRLRQVLDAGFYVRTGVPYPRHCYKKTGHFLLILAHDGGNQFLYWNTLAHETGDYGRAFGFIEYTKGRLQMRRGEYPVIYLHPLPNAPFAPTCRDAAGTAIENPKQ